MTMNYYDAPVPQVADIMTPNSIKIGVKLDGVEQKNIVAYNVLEGWVRQGIKIRGRFKLEQGRIVSVIRYGKVEPYWRMP